MMAMALADERKPKAKWKEFRAGLGPQVDWASDSALSIVLPLRSLFIDVKP
jgi:hypothetical protein